MTIRLVLAVCCLVALSGCGTISALEGATAPLDVFELRAQPQPQAARQSPVQVIVELPSTTGALDTDRIMIRPNALQAQYLPEVRWGDPVPVMLQTLMLRSIESTGAFAYVGRRPLGAGGDFAILTELRDFQAELDPEGETATVRLQMTARMLREGDMRIVATRAFAATAPAASTETGAIIAAFDAAAAQLMPDITSWALASAGAR
ncbi:MAG: membrane integrity-associated transporter subunit PqiC [Rubellimicrobium sp.]|nr:membrane integrity-associated transporter subunit PqiC [Rubellimicrobium sp.]